MLRSAYQESSLPWMNKNGRTAGRPTPVGPCQLPCWWLPRLGLSFLPPRCWKPFFPVASRQGGRLPPCVCLRHVQWALCEHGPPLKDGLLFRLDSQSWYDLIRKRGQVSRCWKTHGRFGACRHQGAGAGHRVSLSGSGHPVLPSTSSKLPRT